MVVNNLPQAARSASSRRAASRASWSKPRPLQRKGSASRRISISKRMSFMPNKRRLKEALIEEEPQVAAPFDISEVVIGKQLRSGQFCDEYSVKGFITNRCFEEDLDANLVMSTMARQYVVNETRQGSNPDGRFAIKFIQERWMASYNEFECAAHQLSNEAELLMELKHPHITRLRGVAKDLTEAYYLTSRHDSFFLILDRLQESLSDRIKTWTKQRNSMERSMFLERFNCNSRKLKRRKAKFLRERLQIAEDLARALEYLHNQGIVHGDVSSANCGFDYENKVQLCNFGEARRIPVSNDEHFDQEKFYDENPVDNISHTVGKFQDGKERKTRYAHLSSDTKDDVFAFTTLLCEMLTLPQRRNKRSRNLETVVSAIPQALQHILKTGWSRDPTERPSMTAIRTAIRNTIIQIDVDEIIGEDESFMTSSVMYSLQSSSLTCSLQSSTIREVEPFHSELDPLHEAEMSKANKNVEKNTYHFRGVNMGLPRRIWHSVNHLTHRNSKTTIV